MATEYDIRANLTLKDRGFSRQVTRTSDRIRRMSQALTRARGAGGGLFRTLTSLGATYFGFQAIGAGIRMAVGGMFNFQRQVEQTQIGLQSIIASIDGISFEQAGASARAVWSALAEDALTSTATTQEMFGIFQGIVGPIRAAGNSLETVRQITGSTVAAASALGVDFAQAQRDIGLMVRGTAGMDTRMFAILRSMGLITQTTEEWNRQLTTQDRIRELQRALGSFDAAAAAYGQSFAGATSSFKDIVQQLSGAMGRPIFDSIRRFLLRTNEAMLENRDSIERMLSTMGSRIASVLDRVFAAAADGMSWVVRHWQDISRQFQSLQNTLQSNAPMLRQLAVGVAAFATLRSTLGPILGVIGGAVSIFETIAGLTGLGAGGAAGAGAGAGAGGGAGAAGAAGASAVFAPLIIILAAIAGVVTVVVQYFDQLWAIFQGLMPVFEALWGQVQETARLLWEVLRPVLKMVGSTFVVAFVFTLLALVAVLRLVLGVLNFLLEILAWVANAIETYLIDPILGFIFEVAGAIARFMGRTIGADPRKTGGGARDSTSAVNAPESPTALDATENLMDATPEARPTTVNNFQRGSVTVRQEFREADPDRVLVRMTQDINRQAEQRLGSGFAPALTR